MPNVFSFLHCKGTVTKLSKLTRSFILWWSTSLACFGVIFHSQHSRLRLIRKQRKFVCKCEFAALKKEKPYVLLVGGLSLSSSPPSLSPSLSRMIVSWSLVLSDSNSCYSLTSALKQTGGSSTDPVYICGVTLLPDATWSMRPWKTSEIC